MLKKTFAHIPHIGLAKETELWASNIQTWDDYLLNYDKISSSNKEQVQMYVAKSIDAYNAKNYVFFIDALPLNLHWRAYNELKDNCCFLDIETTGLSKHHDDITVIGLYNGIESKFFINGINLNEFPKEIQKYNMIVTYNGRCFDLPFIKAKFPKMDFNKFHVDLRYAMKEIGYSGGLKYIETIFGLARDEDIHGVDGLEAVRLWHRYKRGDNSALNLLLKYNRADIENLKPLMEFTFNKLKEKYCSERLVQI